VDKHFEIKVYYVQISGRTVNQKHHMSITIADPLRLCCESHKRKLCEQNAEILMLKPISNVHVSTTET